MIIKHILNLIIIPMVFWLQVSLKPKLILSFFVSQPLLLLFFSMPAIAGIAVWTVCEIAAAWIQGKTS
jgi:hypothetical protein